jgi:hypothetical protein
VYYSVFELITFPSDFPTDMIKFYEPIKWPKLPIKPFFCLWHPKYLPRGVRTTSYGKRANAEMLFGF